MAQFTSIITAPTQVRLQTGVSATFTPRPQGGMFDGKRDPNLSGPNGYTYGYVRVRNASGKQVTITGYVCHHAGVFNALKGRKNAILVTRPEPNRVGLGSGGFPALASATV